MKFQKFQTLRDACLQERRFPEARSLECAYLAEHPGCPQALWMCAWTSRAMARPDEAQMFDNMARFALSARQGQRYRKFFRTTRRILAAISDSPAHALFVPEAGFETLVSEPMIDAVPGWLNLTPQQAAPGDTVDLGAFGCYRLRDPDRVIEKRLSRHMPWEAPVSALLIDLARAMPQAAAMVDVGANIGCASIPMALHHAGRVFAFEPVAETFDELQGNIALNRLANLTARRAACGARDGRAGIVPGPRDNPGLARVGGTLGGPGQAVEMLRLDGLFADRRVGLLKMDVEGYELQVLRGARAVLRRDRPIVVAELQEGAQSQAAEFLRGLGYVGQRLFRSDYVFYIP
jgi:FkbM family methyltransferase